MSGRRVVVTGLGVVSALGPSRAEFWQCLVDGRSAIGQLRGFEDRELSIRVAAQITTFDPAAGFEGGPTKQPDRFVQLLLLAAREALADAGLELGEADRPRTAVVTGSSLGGLETLDRTYYDLYGRGRPRLPPLTIPQAMPNAGASHLAIEIGAEGPSFTTATACSSSNHAIGQAFWLLRHGAADVAVTGGSEAPFTWGNLKSWEAMRTTAPDTCRPFSRDRQGMVLGEGGGALVLETLEHARRRDAAIHAELVGFGMSSDASHLTRPASAGAVRALVAALEDAALDPEDVGYVNAHGTGTAANDPSECAALRTVFGTHADRLPISSTKSMHGHTLGAAGALEAVATVLALREGVLPPTANFTEADPECDLDVIPNVARQATPRAALSSSFAFGGLNAVLAFRRWAG